MFYNHTPIKVIKNKQNGLVILLITQHRWGPGKHLKLEKSPIPWDLYKPQYRVKWCHSWFWNPHFPRLSHSVYRFPNLLSFFSKCIQAECSVERARLSWARAALSYWTSSPRLPWVFTHLMLLFPHPCLSSCEPEHSAHNTRCAWFHLQLKQNATQTPLAYLPILGRHWGWANPDVSFTSTMCLLCDLLWANPVQTSHFPA